MEIFIGKNMWDVVPTNHEGQEDWSLANNGGHYAFGHRDVFVDDCIVGDLKTTSAEFEFCEITGSFQRTIHMIFGGRDIFVAECYEGFSEQEIVQEIKRVSNYES